MKLFYIIGMTVLLYFLTIMPRMRKKPDSKPFLNKYYAHRGFFNNKTNTPENSLNAFREATKREYGIELDVQLTKDKIAVVFHDYSLKRVCGIDKKVKEYTYDELKQFHLFQSNEKIPRLTEALELIDGKVPIIVELKLEGNVIETCKIVDSILRGYKGQYCMESFHPLGLVWYRIHHPDIVRGQLATNFIKDKKQGNKLAYFVLQNLLLNFLAKPDFIAYRYKYKNNLSFLVVTKFYRAFAFAWTIKSQKELDRCKESFDSFIFDSFIPDKIEAENQI